MEIMFDHWQVMSLKATHLHTSTVLSGDPGRFTLGGELTGHLAGSLRKQMAGNPTGTGKAALKRLCGLQC